jgi:hypothetical protein
MTPEEWVQGLDLPNLMRYGTPGQVRGLIAAAIREAVAEEREECAKIMEQGSGAYAHRIAAAIRARGKQ